MEWKEYIKQYRLKNRDKIRLQERERYANTSKEWRAAVVLKNKKRRIKLRLEAIEKYGGKCMCCAEKQIEFLCIDHIAGGGNKHRKQMTTKSIGEWLYANKYPKGFQVLCFNCNSAKSAYKKCPHNK